MEITKAKKPPLQPTDHSSAVDAIVMFFVKLFNLKSRIDLSKRLHDQFYKLKRAQSLQSQTKNVDGVPNRFILLEEMVYCFKEYEEQRFWFMKMLKF